MIRFGFNCLVTVVALVVAANAAGASTNAAPDFREVYQLVQSNLAGVTDADLDHAALDGLLAAFDGRVLLEGDGTEVGTNLLLVSHMTTFENGVGYVQVNRVVDGLAPALASAVRGLNATNALKGLVLDLRFAHGSDFAAAVAAAELFVSREQPLLDWGKGPVHSAATTNALTLPVAVLVNHETRSAAEALAAMLRETGSGLLLGNTTAGRAMVLQDYPLKNGQRLRIATRPVKLGDGTELSVRGVKVDIEVPVDAKDERVWFDSPYAILSPTNSPSVATESTESPHRMRPSEAELVREKREEDHPDVPPPAPRPAEPEKPRIQDPVLERAVDLLKALAVVREAHG